MKKLLWKRASVWRALLTCVSLVLLQTLIGLQGVSKSFVIAAHLRLVASNGRARDHLSSGQLESFSPEWTGLGDQEGSNAWKKMDKRDWSAKLDQAAAGDNEEGARRAMFAIEAPEAHQLRPIIIARRQAETLLEPSEQLLDDPDTLLAHKLIALQDPESFGSRVSLLTTRKMRPDELLDRRPELLIDQVDGRSLPDQARLVALMDLERRYLPRVARARFM